MSYRISYDVGLRNVAPYGFMNAIVTRSQIRTLLDVLQREQVSAVFTPEPGSFIANEGDASPAQLELLVDMGWKPVETSDGMIAFRRA